jgi:DNA-binding transcriptional regulator YdaS (Cro superfamily)
MVKKPALDTPLDRAIKAAGNQQLLAELIGVKQQHVSYWKKKGRQRVPAQYCAKIEEQTGVSRHELRPDVFGDAPGQAA